VTGYFSTGFFRICPSYLHNPLSFPFGNGVPDLTGTFIAASQTLKALFLITLVPLIEGAAGYSDFEKSLSYAKRRLLDHADYFHFLGLRVFHVSLDAYSKPFKVFFRTLLRSMTSATSIFSSSFSSRSSLTSLEEASLMVSPLSCLLPASRNDLLYL